MHQKFLFQEDEHEPALDEKAAGFLIHALQEGRVVLAGDTFIDRRDSFPNPNGEMDHFAFCVSGGDDVTPAEPVEPKFDFDTYYGITGRKA